MTKQQEITMYLSKVPSATIDEIYANVSFCYYCNANKHLGAVLSRMVKAGKIQRVKKGVFRFVSHTGNNSAGFDEMPIAQPTLFDNL